VITQLDVAAGSRRVLVVEDDASLQLLFKALLRRHGFVVECVPDGVHALSRLDGESYDAVLLDLMMPGVNGFDVLTDLALRGHPMLSRVIVTTGVNEKLLNTIDRSRVFAVIRKPFDIDNLVDTITRCAAKHAPRDHGSSRHRESQKAARLDDEGEGAILRMATTRLNAHVTDLRRLLAAATSGERERLLRSELRHALSKLAALLGELSTADRRASRRLRFARLAARADHLVRVGSTNESVRTSH
jgi:CheY-like chemotaxis protein